MAVPTQQPLIDGCERHSPFTLISLHLPNPAQETPDVLPGQQAVCRENPVAEESYALLDREDDVLRRMQTQTQANQEVSDLFSHFGQMPFLLGEHQKIIDVADVALDSQPVLDEVIERVQIDVCEKLVGLVADGDASLAGAYSLSYGTPTVKAILRG
jgi:hypothetical protein